MHAKIPTGHDAPFDKPADNAPAAVPPPVAVPPASKLSAAFGTALGGRGRLGHIPPSGNGGLTPGHGRPDQINKASKPTTGAKRTLSRGHGHR